MKWQQEQVMEVQVQSLEISSNSTAIAKGAHLAAIKGCAECHGDDGSGKVMLEDPAMGLIAASNLTRGKGGLPSSYNNTDWVRALKHGLRTNGTPLLVMPSQETTLLSAEDMSAIIAYYNSLPPVDKQLPQQCPCSIENGRIYLSCFSAHCCNWLHFFTTSLCSVPSETMVSLMLPSLRCTWFLFLQQLS